MKKLEDSRVKLIVRSALIYEFFIGLSLIQGATSCTQPFSFKCFLSVVTIMVGTGMESLALCRWVAKGNTSGKYKELATVISIFWFYPLSSIFASAISSSDHLQPLLANVLQYFHMRSAGSQTSFAVYAAVPILHSALFSCFHPERLFAVFVCASYCVAFALLVQHCPFAIDSNIPRNQETSTQSTEAQTEHPHCCLYRQFFLTFPQPAFIIDLNIDPRLAKAPILNVSAESVTRAWGSAEQFFEWTYLDRRTFAESIHCWRRAVDNDVPKWSKVQVGESAEDGEVYEMSTSVFDDDREVRKLGVIMIEPPKHVKREKELLKHVKTSLICSLSHELCTPMNSLMPLLKMMPSCMTNDKKEDLKDIALSSSELLYSKIRDLIDYNNIEMAELRLENSEFVVSDLFRELHQIFRSEVLHKNNRMELNVNSVENKTLMIFADKLRIKQILVKLINNANKYTSKGVICVEAIEDNKNLDVKFQVRDTGVGMTKETLDFVFASLREKANFLERQRNQSTKLPGLGLVIAKSIGEAMGSTLHVESQRGKGTTFSFTLPACRIFEMAQGDVPISTLPYGTPPALRSLQRIKSFRAKNKMNATRTRDSERNLIKPFILPRYRANRRLGKDSSLTDEASVESALERVPKYQPVARRESKLMGKLRENCPLSSNNVVLPSTASFPHGSVSTFSELVKPRTYSTDVVLIVDDVYGNRVVLREMLKKQGIATLEAVDGNEALELVNKSLLRKSKERIMLVFMDLNMPVMDGIQATVAIRKLEKESKHAGKIPIVAVTANNTEEDKKACFAAGMQDFIVKPVTFLRLVDLVSRYAKNYESTNDL